MAPTPPAGAGDPILITIPASKVSTNLSGWPLRVCVCDMPAGINEDAQALVAALESDLSDLEVLDAAGNPVDWRRLKFSQTVAAGTAPTVTYDSQWKDAYTVTGCGDSSFNGLYTLAGTHEGKNYYTNSSGRYLCWTDGYGREPGWVLFTSLFTGEAWWAYYYSAGPDPDDATWYLGVEGMCMDAGPAPSSVVSDPQTVEAYSVSGSGDSRYDGIYTEGGTHNGKAYYVYGSRYISWTAHATLPGWVLHTALADDQARDAYTYYTATVTLDGATWSTGTTQAQERLWLWLNTDLSASSDNEFYLYPGCTSPTGEAAASAIPGTGAEMFYAFAEGAGTTLTDWTGSANGTLTNGPTWIDDGGHGALEFDGVDDWVNIGAAGFNPGSGPGTLITFARIVADKTQSLICNRDGSGNVLCKICTNGSLGAWVLEWDPVGSGASVNAPASISEAWQVVVGVYDDAYVRLYVDGVQVAISSSKPSASVNLDNWCLANESYWGGVNYTDGAIAFSAAYSRAWSADEIATLAEMLLDPATFAVATEVEGSTTVYTTPGTIAVTHDATATAEWGTLSWVATTPAGTSIRARTRTAETEAGLAAASWSAYLTESGASIASSDGRWIEVEFELSTTDTSATPELESGTVTYRAATLFDDAGEVTDTFTALYAATVALADGGEGVDVPAPLAGYAAALTDAGEGMDTLAALWGAVVALADSGAGTEALTTQCAYLVALADSGAGTEALTTQCAYLVALADSGAGTEALATQCAYLVALADAGAGTDALTALRDAIVTLTDAGAGTDAISALLAAAVALSDAGVGADALTPLAGYNAALTGAGEGVDSTTFLSGVAVNLADAGAGTDAITAFYEAVVTLADAGAGAEVLIPVYAATVTLMEAGAGVDTIGAVYAATATLVGAGAGTDTIAAAHGYTVALADAGVATDIIGALLGAVVTLTDSGVATDSIGALLGAIANLADSGAGTEAITAVYAATVALTDAGMAADVAAAAKGYHTRLTEAGEGADAIAILQGHRATLTDAGAGTDALTALYAALVALADSGAGTEAIYNYAATVTGLATMLKSTGRTQKIVDSAGRTDGLLESIGRTNGLLEA